jgi:hypothetical protein
MLAVRFSGFEDWAMCLRIGFRPILERCTNFPGAAICEQPVRLRLSNCH